MPQCLRQPDGTLVMTEEPTRSHPDGDAPRLADGAVVGADGLVMPGAEADAVSLPAPKRTRRRATPAQESPAEPAPADPATTAAPEV